MKRGASEQVNVDDLFAVIKADWTQFIAILTSNTSRLAVNQIYKAEKLREADFKLRYLSCLPVSRQAEINKLVPGGAPLRGFIENLAKTAPSRGITRRISAEALEMDKLVGPVALHSDFEGEDDGLVSDYSSEEAGDRSADEESPGKRQFTEIKIISRKTTPIKTGDGDVSDYSSDDDESDTKSIPPPPNQNKPSSQQEKGAVSKSTHTGLSNLSLTTDPSKDFKKKQVASAKDFQASSSDADTSNKGLFSDFSL